MGVKRIMETFFSGMQDQSMSGFGGRIVNTPMGPFRWNDGMQLWENVNNGMVMNNISFQDSMFMMDYLTTVGGGGGENVLPGDTADRSPILLGLFGNIIGNTTDDITLWASLAGPTTSVTGASGVTFSDIDTIITIALQTVLLSGSPNLPGIVYSKNNGPIITSTGGLTMQNGDFIKLGGVFPKNTGGLGATGNIRIRNNSFGSNLLASITWSYQYTGTPPEAPQ